MKQIAAWPALDVLDRTSAGQVKRAAKAVFWAVLVGVLYFVGARVGLAFLAKPEGVAVFWPASGIAAGMLVRLGRQATLPVFSGVFVATIAANLLGDRNLSLAVVFGFCNGGEALLFGWLLARDRDGHQFDNLKGVLRFFLALALSTAMMAVVAALAIRLAGASHAEFVTIWQMWWASDAIGIVAFAPMFIALADRPGEPLLREEFLEGTLVVAALTVAACTNCFTSSLDAAWWQPVPFATIFPLLLWAAARCRTIFLAVGLMVVALVIVLAVTAGHGQFGNQSIPIGERVFAARVTIASFAFCGLVLIAVFNDRRTTLDAMRVSEQRFSRLAATAPGIIYTFRLDKDGRRTIPYASPTLTPIMGLTPAEVRDSADAAFVAIHPHDVGNVNARIVHSLRDMTPFHAQFRYRHPTRGEIWLEGHSNPVREADGAVMWHGFMQDITARKVADARLGMLMGELDHRAKNLLAVVQAVAFHTAAEENPNQFADTFNLRIASLAASHDLLTRSAWEGVDLATLIRSQLGHFAHLLGTRIILEGPAVTLKASAAQAIGMALHELATNASKYGALASDEGEVRIAWSRGDRLAIGWIERKGGVVAPPAKFGFGHKVMVEMLEYELDASVGLDYASTGLVWQFSAPCRAILEANCAIVLQGAP